MPGELVMEQYERKFSGNPFMDHNYVSVEHAENGNASCTLSLRRESLNVYGYAHGGALYTIADDAAGFAAHADGRAYVTQSSTMHFLSNRSEGILTGTANVRHRGRRTCLVDVEITDEAGKLLVTGSFEFFCVGEKSPVPVRTDAEHPAPRSDIPLK